MRRRTVWPFMLLVLALIGMAAAARAQSPDGPAPQAPDFNRQIRPILAGHCFKCHGPDEQTREAGLRLDRRDGALSALESGATAIVPGKPDDSALVERILASDGDQMMPPPTANKPLSAEQKQLLRDWVAAGAPYAEHWAFVPPVQAPLPAIHAPDWPRGAIDTFLLAEQEAAGLAPSPAADRHTLVRRVYLDLIGLPPTPEDAQAFAADQAPEAYERLVDRLLASPHYGERWARRWLDLARYADTNGYEKDRVRSMWPYRDWVIGALNADLPFDQFTIQQIAGDMLPGAGTAERIATGFHRNTMINEEGGIDPLEFRYYAMVDRVNTTGTVWLGLTLGCANCHTHKYDPLTQQDYYRFFAMLNNADEPELEIAEPDAVSKRQQIEQHIAAAEAALPSQFPLPEPFRWQAVELVEFTSAAGATATRLDDGSVRFEGENPPQDAYTLSFLAPTANAAALRIVALPDAALPKSGPGRAPHGNFVVTDVKVDVAVESSDEPMRIQPTKAEADFAQDGFSAAGAIDDDAKTGWAIHGPEPWNVARTLSFTWEPLANAAPMARWTVRIDQQHGNQHTVGRLRLELGTAVVDDRSPTERRQAHLEEKLAAWQEALAAKAVRWSLLKPTRATSNLPTLDIQDDDSILVSGDQSKSDLYDITLDVAAAGLKTITALRLECLSDSRLPKRGPGRIYYEGPSGDFFLSEIALYDGQQRLPWAGATQTFASGPYNAALAIDGDQQSGWSINGAQGRDHAAVFRLQQPLAVRDALRLTLLFERYYAAGLGRFRVWATDDPRGGEAIDLPLTLQHALLVPRDQWTAEQRVQLVARFCAMAPELATAWAEIDKLRQQLPELPSTLVFQERLPEHTRKTFQHRRGEYLQPTVEVQPATLAVASAQTGDAGTTRLDLARWLVDARNPLTGRVTVNRHWAAFFGRGLVRTTEDFGYQGEAPTHGALLDWLAVELPRQDWSIKRLHRMIVTSAAYQQSSRVLPTQREKDPQNKLLARAPRLRLEAELVRDSALHIGGLLSARLGGPSVFPPQPASVTTEGAYGQLAWKESAGGDRYRRGLYTFAKRTAPYAMFNTFDAPSGEACVARREASNTPLQALTMLNDGVLVEVSRALGKQLAAGAGTTETRVDILVRRVLTRPPREAELVALAEFHAAQRSRLKRGQLDPLAVMGVDDKSVAGLAATALAEQAAWTLTARAVLNLDEAIAKD